MKLNVVWLGDLGFPFGVTSVVQKTLLVCKGLTQSDVNMTVINRFGLHDPDAGLNLKTEGTYEKINYIHASGSPYRPNNIIVRNILKNLGLINEIYILYKLRKSRKCNAAILHTDKFQSILFYRIISKLLDFPLVMAYVELYSSISTRHGIRHKINGYLYEKYGFYLLDGMMPISDYLVNIVKSHSPQLPMLKVPMIADFDRFNEVERNTDEKYFLFCSGADYFDVIIFVLKAFELLESSEEPRLYLVVTGQPSQMSRLDKEIAKNKKNNLIKLYSGISYAQLTNLYANACGLLIPLQPTIQDTARFPHKLGEYLASGNPVVTTNYGEVAKHFKDEESALMAQSYDIGEFAHKMEYIFLNPKKAKEIGQKGKVFGLKNFDYNIYGSKIKEFINSIIMQKAQ